MKNLEKNLYKSKIFNLLVTWRLFIDSIDDYKNQSRKNNIKITSIYTPQYLRENQLTNIIGKFDGIICGDDKITKKVIDKAKNLKIISKWGTGIDSIDKKYAVKKGIYVCNSPGTFTKSAAQHAIALMFALTRNIVTNDKDIRNGFWTKKICNNIENKTIGIIGFGRIGKEIFRQLKSFRSNFIFNDIKKNKNFLSLKLLLKKSDIIFIACDLNPKSKNLISYKEIIQMKKSAILINVSRGAIINNNDLEIALKRKIISGAGLDVFDPEPLKKNS